MKAIDCGPGTVQHDIEGSNLGFHVHVNCNEFATGSCETWNS